MPYTIVESGVLEDGRQLAGSTLATISNNITRVERGNAIVIETNEVTRSSGNGSAQEQTVNFTWKVFLPPEGKIFSGISTPQNFNVRFGTTTAPPEGAVISMIPPSPEFVDNGTFSFANTQIPRTGNPSIPNFSSNSWNGIYVFSDRLIVSNGSMRHRFTMGGGNYSASVVQYFELIPVYSDLGGLQV